MKHNTNLQNLQDTIRYHFNNQDYLINAVTHSSYANELKINKRSDNERLEFLGDAVLELISSEFLFNTYKNMNEGKLTTLRASMVCEPSLAFCARQIGLEQYIRLGKGEDATGGRNRDSIISDALEAVIGAVYLDGGFTSAKEFVLNFILNDIDNKKLFYDSKTILQEMMQANGLIPQYRILNESGPEHCKTFEAEVYTNSEILGRGEGHNKKAAEQKAAYNAIILLKSAQQK